MLRASVFVFECFVFETTHPECNAGSPMVICPSHHMTRPIPFEFTQWKCVVPGNIQTPTTEGIGNSRGVGVSEAQEIPKGRGVGP